MVQHLQLTPADTRRFNKKFIKTGHPKGCWEWQAGVFKHFNIGAFYLNGQNRQAYKVAFVNNGGVLTPEKPWVCHTCDNPLCVNPAHLYACTPQNNMDDRSARGRLHQCHGESNTETLLTNAAVKYVRKHYRFRHITFKQLGRRFNVSESTVRRAYHMNTWKHVGA